MYQVVRLVVGAIADESFKAMYALRASRTFVRNVYARTCILLVVRHFLLWSRQSFVEVYN